jgi:16S rRNA (guanine966-N2)-methyltransferase
MRVVAGTARGRRLVAPRGLDVRPTTDRVREAVGNRLQSMGVLRDARVVDLFAGTGALGIEALSRGAAHATFVENAPGALQALRENLDSLGFSEQATVVRGDASRFGGGPFDIAFIDPPYVFAEWDALLRDLDADIVVCESRREIELPPPWQLVRSDRYGTTVVTLGQRGTS